MAVFGAQNCECHTDSHHRGLYILSLFECYFLGSFLLAAILCPVIQANVVGSFFSVLFVSFFHTTFQHIIFICSKLEKTVEIKVSAVLFMPKSKWCSIFRLERISYAKHIKGESPFYSISFCKWQCRIFCYWPFIFLY